MINYKEAKKNCYLSLSSLTALFLTILNNTKFIEENSIFNNQYT
ncbi:hypothetical protein ACFP3I_24980 [Chryseobacterium arachidis]